MAELDTTWDGVAVAPDPPFGAMVVVFRRSPTRLLMLHRAHLGPDFSGDWAWTPPTGARQPGEDIVACALRELAEEAGIRDVPISRLDVRGDRDVRRGEWQHYGCELPDPVEVRLVDPEHDRFEWLPVAEALRRVSPEFVRADLATACRLLGL